MQDRHKVLPDVRTTLIVGTERERNDEILMRIVKVVSSDRPGLRKHYKYFSATVPQS